MKGKGNYRFDMPNAQRLRSRIENPSKDLSSQLREKLQEVACKVLNANLLSIKAELISFVDGLGLTFKNEAHKAQVYNLTNSIFDTYFGATPEALAAITGETGDDDGSDDADAPEMADAGEDFAEAPAPKEVPVAPAPATKGSKAPKAAPADEFD